MSYDLFHKAASLTVSNPSNKPLLLVLAILANNEDECWPSKQYLAETIQVADRTIKRMLAALEADGHITRSFRSGHSTIYRIHPETTVKTTVTTVKTTVIQPEKATPTLSLVRTRGDAHVPTQDDQRGDAHVPGTFEAGGTPMSPIKQEIYKPNKPSDLFDTESGSNSVIDKAHAKKKKPASELEFEAVYSQYPRKVGRGAGLKAWMKLNPSPELQAEILSGLTAQKDAKMFSDDKQFVPHFSTWLNAQRWQDEIVRPKLTGKFGEVIGMQALEIPEHIRLKKLADSKLGIVGESKKIREDAGDPAEMYYVPKEGELTQECW